MRAAKWLMTGALLATVLIYWVGLHGPFVLDDGNNLNPISEWLRGDNTWRQTLLYNTSGMLGRSLSMATLMLSAWLGGYDPFAFKLGNLLLHLLCGLVGWQVLRCALARDRHLAGYAGLTSALLAILWLIHPLNVSTVLYAVQRMAQVSTLLTLAALWAYLAARTALQNGQTRRAAIGLFVLFPLLLLAGLLGKENAAITPALCLVLELAYFRGGTVGSRTPANKRMLLMFYGVFLVVPTLLMATLLALHPEYLLGGYIGRDFTLTQRLLSEGRALMDYIGAVLLPRGPTMGVFTDDFATSSGLLSPPTTLYALLALAAITSLAIAIRKQAPSVFAGWFFFLVAHAVESSFLPLELYFEHRNYLPAFGLLLAAGGMAEFITRRLKTEALSRRQLGFFFVGAYALALGFATHGRASVWADEGSLLTQETQHHPGSVRANVALALYAIFHNHPAVARAAMDNLLQSPDPRTRELGHLNRVLVDCASQGRATPSDLHEAALLALPRVTLNEMYVFEDLASIDAARPCTGASAAELADTIEALLTATQAQPDGQRPKWRLRLAAADLHARAGDWSRALLQAQLAWQPNAEAAVGDFLVRAYMHNGMRVDAERTYGEVARRIKPGNIKDRQGLEELRKLLDRSAEASSG
jgi:hypothetical protein